MFPVHIWKEKFENGRFTLKVLQMFSVHIGPKELENGGFTLKTRQMFSAVHTTPEELEIASIIDHFRFVFEGNQRNHIIIDAKSSVYKTFSVHTETKMQRF